MYTTPPVDHTVCVWSVEGTEGVWTAQDRLCARAVATVPQDAAVRALCALSVPQPRVWVADEAGALVVWHGESHAQLRTVVPPGSAEARVGCMVSTDEGVWCGDDRGGLRLYDALSTALLARHTTPHQQPLQHLAGAAVVGSHGGRLGIVWAAYGDSTVHAWRVLESLPQHVCRVRTAVEEQRKGIVELQRRLPEALAQAAGQLAAAETRSALLGKRVHGLEMTIAIDTAGPAAREEEAANDARLVAASNEQRAVAGEVENALLRLRDQIDLWLEAVRDPSVQPISPRHPQSLTAPKPRTPARG